MVEDEPRAHMFIGRSVIAAMKKSSRQTGPTFAKFLFFIGVCSFGDGKIIVEQLMGTKHPERTATVVVKLPRPSVAGYHFNCEFTPLFQFFAMFTNLLPHPLHLFVIPLSHSSALFGELRSVRVSKFWVYILNIAIYIL